MGITDRGRGRSSSNWNFTKYSLLSAANYTASATHTQAGATPMTAMYCDINVGGVGDTARLPPAKSGLCITVFNEAGNTVSIYPAGAAQGGVAGGDQINALGVNTLFSLTVALSPTIFTCVNDGKWLTK